MNLNRFLAGAQNHIVTDIAHVNTRTVEFFVNKNINRRIMTNYHHAHIGRIGWRLRVIQPTARLRPNRRARDHQ